MTDVPLTISLNDFDHERALDAWRWLVPTESKPFLLTAFGDWILGAPDGSIHALDTIEGTIRFLTATGSEFNDAVDNDPDKRDEWLLEGLVLGQASRGVFLEKGSCFGFVIHPIIGGSFEADNIQPYDIIVYQTIVGALHERIRDLPPGAVIDRFTVDGKDPGRK